MSGRARIRKTIKWGGAVVTVLLVAVWIGSARWSITWALPTRILGINSGGIVFDECGPLPFFVAPGWDLSTHVVIGTRWWNRLVFLPSFDSDGWFVPLWPIVGLAMLITLTAWRRDTRVRRRARVILCPRCNYDRTGLAAGAVCPECGSGGPPA